jgi:GNAT superfamily N-acetyltransferase
VTVGRFVGALGLQLGVADRCIAIDHSSGDCQAPHIHLDERARPQWTGRASMTRCIRWAAALGVTTSCFGLSLGE